MKLMFRPFGRELLADPAGVWVRAAGPRTAAAGTRRRRGAAGESPSQPAAALLARLRVSSRARIASSLCSSAAAGQRSPRLKSRKRLARGEPDTNRQ